MSDVDLGSVCPSCHEPWLRPATERRGYPGPLTGAREDVWLPDA